MKNENNSMNYKIAMAGAFSALSIILFYAAWLHSTWKRDSNNFNAHSCNSCDSFGWAYFGACN